MSDQPTVLLAIDGDTTRILYHRLARTVPNLTVILEEPVSKFQLLKHRVKRLGVAKVIGQILFLVFYKFLLLPLSRKRIREIQSKCDLNLAAIPDAKITRVKNLNTKEAVEILRRVNPRLVIVNGTRILRDIILTSVSAPFWNLHLGITPLYRGVHGGYWALTQSDAKNFGVTLHAVDKGIDTGAVIAQQRFAPELQDNFATYPYLQIAEGAFLLEKILESSEVSLQNDGKTPHGSSRQWYHPTIMEYMRYRIAGIK